MGEALAAAGVGVARGGEEGAGVCDDYVHCKSAKLTSKQNAGEVEKYETRTSAAVCS